MMAHPSILLLAFQEHKMVSNGLMGGGGGLNQCVPYIH